jgi:predicted PurR-regulated permease PerM
LNYLLRLLLFLLLFFGIVFGIVSINRQAQKIVNIQSKENLKGLDLILEFKKNIFIELEEVIKKRDNERNRNN